MGLVNRGGERVGSLWGWLIGEGRGLIVGLVNRGGEGAHCGVG